MFSFLFSSLLAGVTAILKTPPAYYPTGLIVIRCCRILCRLKRLAPGLSIRKQRKTPLQLLVFLLTACEKCVTMHAREGIA